MKAEIPYFHGNVVVEDFLDWQIEVDRFFEIREIPEHKHVKMVAFHLKSTAAVWWDRLTTQRQRQRKGPVRSWRRMKLLMSDRFLTDDYEKILYQMYLDCSQGSRSVSEYTTEFIDYSDRNKIGETEGQRVIRYINSLKLSLQEKIGLQTAWTVSEASNLTMKAELMEKTRDLCIECGNSADSSLFQSPRATTTAKPTAPKLVNPYAKPSAPKCYRCGLLGHKSNECCNRRTTELVDVKRIWRQRRIGVDFEEEKVNIVFQRVLLALFRSYCSINKKICNLIIDNGSCENLVAQKLVDYLGLPTQPHESPYALGWVKKGPQARVTLVCKVPFSIGKYYKEEVLYDVLDMDTCHILLGRPWQYDNNVTHKRRDNVMLFRWGD
ncbi:LOW QUALITY PROTEIN: hypothetical protein OSB04_019594 [Centaurea solstitialis]|uniref:CCHC-type domain-containing protein n=1 Tax=Centaurea solstitialis TaxID=347529 RepID=A0AA38T436_9ASTR|nr:LOW QUALITY PROTEIN: hypothetical protein OSB04_019594 [Centaurea solstitialis]